MIYFFACVFIILNMLFSYIFIKTYQLSGYKISGFLDDVFTFNLAFGSKNKLRWTKRMIRFCAIYFCMTCAIVFCSYIFLSNNLLIVLNTFMLFLLTPLNLCIVHFLLLPFENLIKKFYIYKAKKKLSKKTCKCIGITGSYGKTSTKNILAHILEKEYKVCVTPQNYNTEMGITKTILNNLDDEDIFIAEMGARHVHDIKKLCDIVKPDYAILTTLGPQHLETFGSMENIERTKNELVENSKPNALVVFNCDNIHTKKLYNKCKKPKFACNYEGAYGYAEDVEYSDSGSNFTLVLDGKKQKVKTKLLGQCNINNIVCAAALAYLMGVPQKDIISAIGTLEPTPHRLQLIKESSINILDDSYNSNLTGSKEALNVLGKFAGRKIVITPGYVELGDKQAENNFALGAEIAEVCDYLIIMNQLNKNQILAGAISHNLSKKKIYFANTRNEQKEILSKLTCENCVVLFENDLPDNFK